MKWLSRDGAIVALLFLVLFACGSESLILTPTLPQMAAELSVSIEVAGLWVTSYAAAVGVFALIFGPISDRFGRRIVLIIGVFTLSLGTLWCGLSSSFAGVFAARAFSGAAAGMLVTSITSYVGDHFDSSNRAEAMSWVVNGSFLSLILGMPAGAFLVSAVGWQAMFQIVAVILFALFFVLLVLLPDPRSAQKTTSLSAAAAARAYLGLLRDGRLWGLLSMAGVNGVSMTMYSVYLSPWMLKEFGFDTHHRGMVYAVGGPAVIIGAPIAGKLADRYGRIRIAVAGTLLVAAFLAVMPFSHVLGRGFASTLSLDDAARFGGVPWPDTAPLFFCALAVLLGGATRSGPYQTLAQETVSPEQRGSFAALINSFFQSGGALGAAAGGALWVISGESYYVICFVASAANLLAAYLLWALSPRQERR